MFIMKKKVSSVYHNFRPPRSNLNSNNEFENIGLSFFKIGNRDAAPLSGRRRNHHCVTVIFASLLTWKHAFRSLYLVFSSCACKINVSVTKKLLQTRHCKCFKVGVTELFVLRYMYHRKPLPSCFSAYMSVYINPNFHLAIGPSVHDVNTFFVAKAAFSPTMSKTDSRGTLQDRGHNVPQCRWWLHNVNRCPSIGHAGSVHNTGLPLSVGDLSRWTICWSRWVSWSPRRITWLLRWITFFDVNNLLIEVDNFLVEM